MLVFHPWEFADLSSINLPGYIRGRNGRLLKKLEDYIEFCKKRGYDFLPVFDFLQKSLNKINHHTLQQKPIKKEK